MNKFFKFHSFRSFFFPNNEWSSSLPRVLVFSVVTEDSLRASPVKTAFFVDFSIFFPVCEENNCVVSIKSPRNVFKTLLQFWILNEIETRSGRTSNFFSTGFPLYWVLLYRVHEKFDVCQICEVPPRLCVTLGNQLFNYRLLLFRSVEIRLAFVPRFILMILDLDDALLLTCKNLFMGCPSAWKICSYGLFSTAYACFENNQLTAAAIRSCYTCVFVWKK